MKKAPTKPQKKNLKGNAECLLLNNDLHVSKVATATLRKYWKKVMFHQDKRDLEGRVFSA